MNDWDKCRELLEPGESIRDQEQAEGGFFGQAEAMPREGDVFLTTTRLLWFWSWPRWWRAIRWLRRRGPIRTPLILPYSEIAEVKIDAQPITPGVVLKSQQGDMRLVIVRKWGPIYLNRKGKIDKRSRTFAKVMRKALDRPDLPAQIAGRNLGVLRNNRAHAEVLVEIHNVHDKGEAYRLRFHKNRQGDAERIVKGALAYAAGR